MRSKELPAWLWLWFPPVLLVFRLGVRVFAPELFHAWFSAKEGPEEWATVLVLVPGIACGVLALLRRQLLPSPLARLWLSTAILGAFYFGGEEISWGQKLWKWETPAPLAEINRQDETNLHNINSLFNEKPREALELWILVGGIVLPLWNRQRHRPAFPESGLGAWFWPTAVCVPAAVLAIAVRIPDRLERFGVDALESKGMRLSEIQEYYFALFLALYLASFHRRLKRAAEVAQAEQDVEAARLAG
jgi:hypothetical protein